MDVETAALRRDEMMRRYHDCCNDYTDAIQAWVSATVTDLFPDAIQLVVEGDMEGSNFTFRLRGQRLVTADGTLVSEENGDPCDVDDQRCSEAFTSMLDDEVDGWLEVMGDVDGQDSWLGEHVIDLMGYGPDCPNCGHLVHDDKPCAGSADEGAHRCACSWPNPDNFPVEHEGADDRCDYCGKTLGACDWNGLRHDVDVAPAED